MAGSGARYAHPKSTASPQAAAHGTPPLTLKLRGIFDVRVDWVAELKEKVELRVEHVDSTNNPADLLTKAHLRHTLRPGFNNFWG